MNELNQQQREAVLSGDGHVLVLAGAGSGKTRVLTERIAYLIRNKNISPARILAFTFTNKAAGEMRGRVQRMLSIGALPFWIGTFHATGLRILRKEADRIGFRRNFAIYDEDDSTSLIKRILKEPGREIEGYSAPVVRNRISSWKNKLVSPEEALENAADDLEERFAEVYRRYTAELKKCNSFDFDDLITRTVELFSAQPAVKERYSRQFKHVLVDEFQDTNTIQMVLIDMLASKWRNLFVVGDDDQAIYGWRGATVENILQFDRVYSGTRIVRLEENYRSTSCILKAANSVISHNRGRKGKELWSRRGEGRPVQIFYADDEREEAEAARETIIGLLRKGFRRSEIAVLYRTHAQSRALEQAMNRGGLPYQIIGGVRFYERREIKDLLGYLKLINNPDDDVNFLRVVNVPKRGIGKVTVERLVKAAEGRSLLETAEEADKVEGIGRSQREKLSRFALMIAGLRLRAADESADGILSDVIEKTGYRGYLLEDPRTAQVRTENMEELLNETRRFASAAEDPSLANFLEEIALISDIDTMKDEESVSLMTLHNSKGLEYRAIIISGLEEGLLPHYSSFSDDSELEEERRLFYVGMTRAKELLFLLAASSRMKFGNWQVNMPSRFLAEIPGELVNEAGRRQARGADEFPLRGMAGGAGIERKKTPSGGKGRFRVGARVEHPSYGVGKIDKVEGSGKDLKVTVYFTRHGSKKFLASYAPFIFR